MNSVDADAWFGLAQVWRHDWLKYLDVITLERAIAAYKHAAEARPGDSEIWLQLVPLLVEKKDWSAAAEAAGRRARPIPSVSSRRSRSRTRPIAWAA
jgi:hypothetical protein